MLEEGFESLVFYKNNMLWFLMVLNSDQIPGRLVVKIIGT